MTNVIDRNIAGQVKYLWDIPATVRGLSVELLLEAVELDLEGIDWVASVANRVRSPARST